MCTIVLIFLLLSVALKIQLYSGSSLLTGSTLGTGFVRPSSEKKLNSYNNLKTRT